MVARATCVVLLAIWVPVISLRAQTQVQPSDAERKADLDAFLADAKTYEITVAASSAAALELVQQPVMNWNGSAFVWTDRGRPEVIATFWKGRNNRTGQPTWQHAFHSL